MASRTSLWSMGAQIRMTIHVGGLMRLVPLDTTVEVGSCGSGTFTLLVPLPAFLRDGQETENDGLGGYEEGGLIGG
jgi:hypothetical protein